MPMVTKKATAIFNDLCMPRLYLRCCDSALQMEKNRSFWAKSAGKNHLRHELRCQPALE
jgi:hypothetical protein